MANSGEIKRYRRFKGWDYAKGVSLFITIATAPRRALFGVVRDGVVMLSALGEKVKEALEAIPLLNHGILLFGYVVMPDHVHFNCALLPGLAEPLKVLGNAIRRFKNYTTKLAKHSLTIKSSGLGFGKTSSFDGRTGGDEASRSDGDFGFGKTSSFDCHTGDSEASRSDGDFGLGKVTSFDGHTGDGEASRSDGDFGLGKATSFDGQTTFGLWQQGYHDYILLSREMIDATERYIAYNPMKWELMYGVEGALRVIEPLFMPRLNPGDYWKGVGNLALLDPAEKLLSLRISRQVQGAAMAKMLARIENAVSQGYIIISGFISKGEQAVRDMLCRRSDARFIRILPSCIPNRRFRPESRYVEPFAGGRYLEIAQGNDEVEFGRRACLDINAEIIEIAKAGEGLALYWKPDGPHKLAERSSAIKSAGGGELRSSAIKSAGGGELRSSAIKSAGGGELCSSAIKSAIKSDGGVA